MTGFIVRGLREQSYAVDLAENSRAALYRAFVNPYDAIVLDVMIPGEDAYEVCRRIRRRGLRTPVLMLAARDAVEDRIRGLDSGADGYLVKPFAFGDLLARLRILALLLAIPFALLIGTSRLYLLVQVGLRFLTPRVAMNAHTVPVEERSIAEPPAYRPLREELRHEGNWLFRRRSYLPLIPLALVLATVVLARTDAPGRAWEGFCFFVAILGMGVRIATVGFVPRGTSGRNTADQRADHLNTTGVYSLVRHPLYLGNFLMWLGVALYPAVWWLAVIVVLVFWLYHERIVFAEEEFLRERFGTSFTRWATRTPAFLPHWKGWTAPELPFSGRTVLRRELSGAFGIVAAFAALNVAAQSAERGTLSMDPLWTIMFFSGAAVFGLLVLLKKRRVLQVADR